MRLLVHLLLGLGIPALLGTALQRALVRRRVTGPAAWISVGLLGLGLGAHLLLLAGIGPARPLHPELVEQLLLATPPRADRTLYILAYGLLGAGLAWSLFQLVRRRIQRLGLLRTTLDPQAEARHDPAWQDLADLRLGLETRLRERAAHPRLEVRISDRIRAPLTLGLLRPVLLCPLALFREDTADTLRALLQREALRVRLGHPWAMALLERMASLPPLLPLARTLALLLELEGDRRFLDHAGPATRKGFLEAPLRPGSGAEEALSLRLCLLRPRNHAPRRIALTLPLGIALGLLLSLSLGAALGPLRREDLRPTRHPNPGEGLAFLDPGRETRLAHVPGGRGLVIDTTHRQRGHCSLSWASRVQAARSTGPCVLCRIRLEARATRPSPLPPLLELGCADLRDTLAQSLHRRSLLQEHLIPLQPGLQDLELTAHLQWPLPPGARLEAWGPTLHIPPGWRVRVLEAAFVGTGAHPHEARGPFSGPARRDTWLGGGDASHRLHLDWSTAW